MTKVKQTTLYAETKLNLLTFLFIFQGDIGKIHYISTECITNFTHVFASLTAVINSRVPQNGELILRRVAAQFRRSFRRNLNISETIGC